jgi:chromosome partitioning protein
MALQVRALLGLADAFIIPSIPDRLSVMGTYGLMERLRRLGTKVPALGILWSLYRSQNEIHRDVIFSASKRSGPYSDLPKPFRTVIPNSVDVARAFQDKSEPRTLSSKYTPRIAILYRDLCKEILYRLRAMRRKQ